ncbi:MAG: hypothetical protein DYG94_02500 [Leptolyngbya sp. PLA3]|nr:MAG: hypothetical protein EDM82_02055 [Cyanobacteria bacterium CYA]MCE7967600.1 hypothetical protein [Leptolyngbya sp. PL-A3]
MGGGLAGGFEFAGEKFRRGEARLGLVLGDGAEARECDTACFGGEDGGSALTEVLNRVETGDDSWALKEVHELGKRDVVHRGDGGEVHLPCDEEIEDLGLDVGGEFRGRESGVAKSRVGRGEVGRRLRTIECGRRSHERHLARRRGGCKGVWAQGRDRARAAVRSGGI